MADRTKQVGIQQRPLIGSGGTETVFDLKQDLEGEKTRVTVDGDPDLRFRVEWGTSTTRVLDNLFGPFSADFPGSVSVLATNTGNEPRRADVSAVSVWAMGRSTLREFIDATGTAQTVQRGAARIINPGGAAVTYTLPNGTAVTIADVAGEIGIPFPISSGAQVTAGRAIVEYEI